jgi:hypothetical protein
MGWFNKKEDKEERSMELPELPGLPEVPEKNSFEENGKDSLHQLPSFPSSPFGQKFSQNAIKEAVAGKRGDNEDWSVDENDSDEEEFQMKPESSKKLFSNEIKDEATNMASINRKELENSPEDSFPKKRNKKDNEPFFVRVDKFEEGIQILEKTKKEVSEIEKMLKDTKVLKEEEEIQLDKWEREIQRVKKQIENLDTEIFSKVE